MGKQLEARYCARCAMRLARDNATRYCAACQNAGHGSLTRPPALPNAFWHTEQMRDALDSWHIGRVLLAYRSHPHHRRVLSQELVSSWLNVTQAQLSRIEKGPAPQDLGKLIYWAQALGIPASLLWFKLPSQRRSVQMVAESENPPPTEILADVLAEPDIFDRPTIGISAFKGMTLQESGERLLKIFLHLDNELGGDSLYQPLSRYVARMAVNVHENPTDGLPAFGQLNQMAGWLALDANYHRAAKGYFTAAIHVGHEVDEPELSASALAYMSLQETYRGRLGTALSLAQTALAINPQRLTPLARTTLGTRLARAHAGLNNDTECLRVLETVRNDFRQAGSRAEPHYLSYVDSIEVAAQQGACYLDLGMSAEAKNALSQAIDLLQTHDPNRVRDHVHYLSRMARCYLLDGEVEQACQTGRNALALGQAIGSTRIFERLKELDSALDPYGHIQCVQEFKDLIRLADAGERSRTYHQ